jgi:tRNA(fMet)-specific endonuclease VapC
MKYLLDTNTCIRHLNQRSDEITRKLMSVAPEDIAVCAIVKAEMFAGAGKSNTREKTLAKQRRFLDQFVSLPFDDVAAEIYGTIRASLEKAGTPIGPLDMLIAAIALANNLILITHNVGEFKRITGLRLEDWEIA